MSGLDRNGYAPSILQDDLSVCFRCGRSCEKLDRHEVYGAANRQKSKALGRVRIIHSCLAYLQALTIASVSRAISSSSLVGMRYTATFELSVESLTMFD